MDSSKITSATMLPIGIFTKEAPKKLATKITEGTGLVTLGNIPTYINKFRVVLKKKNLELDRDVLELIKNQRKIVDYVISRKTGTLYAEADCCPLILLVTVVGYVLFSWLSNNKRSNEQFLNKMSNGDRIKEKIGFIGGGNMAKAICEGIVRKGLVDYNQIYVSGPGRTSLQYWDNLGATTTTANGIVVAECDVIFLSVKPQILPTAVANIYDTLPSKSVKGKLFVSVLAGVTIEALENCLATLEDSRIIRVMPNTPMMVGEGCTVFSPGQRARDGDVALVKTLLEASGVCSEVPESLINSVGALAGSGPAFVFLMIEALSDGGVKMGIPRAMATRFAAQTVLGAAKMVLETGKHTGVLKDEVCSPGGTTIAGIHALEKGGVRAAIIDAIEATTKKAAELAPSNK